MSRSVLFWLSGHNFNSIKSFCLYLFIFCMGTDLVPPALAMHQRYKVVCPRTDLQEGVLSYDLESGKILDLKEELVHASKRALGASTTSSSVNMPTSP